MRSADILRSARVLVSSNTPYKHAGRDAVLGVDCVGVLTVVGRALGYQFEDVAGYSQHPDGLLLERLSRWLGRVENENRQPGDVGVFWLDRKTQAPQHVGFFTESLGLIHAYRHVRRVVEIPQSMFWDKRLLATFRLHGVT